ncbi:helix-turn-helix domain-containing protein (plasmid) [Paracoccus methylovorus]|uniref:Helix-turn-helix domain-containing protein n=1 Tax=Paracoccus methylovorus TaxID=2812658 RepID=A0ABX7JPS2_9RHOB|nr:MULTISPECIES: helix-turn-helix domain-containing protein [Paracoccus]QRZ16253.1 helix-turn-helix domain-containing protein [Paracoccus methylovorus]
MARQSSSNAGRAAEILILLGQADRKGMALAALAEATGEAKSSVHRTLVALADYGLVVQSGNRANYMLGPAAYALAHRSIGVNEIVATYRPALVNITARTQFSTYLMVRSGLDTICLDYQMGQIAAQPYVSGIGGRIPLGVGISGVCILGMMDARSRGHCLNMIEARLAEWELSRAQIEGEIAEFLRNGFMRGIRRSAGIESLTLTLPIRNDSLRGMETAISLLAPLNILDEAAERNAIAIMGAAIHEAEHHADVLPHNEDAGAK